MAHVFGKAGRSLGAGEARRAAAHERDHRQQHEHKTHAHDAAQLRAGFDLVDKVGGLKGNDNVDGDLGQNEHERPDRRLFVLADTLGKLSDHSLSHPFPHGAKSRAPFIFLAFSSITSVMRRSCATSSSLSPRQSSENTRSSNSPIA